MTDDARFMRRAVALAARGLGSTAPNPTVGAVLVRDGQVIGEGHTQPVGGPHAEIMALRQAASLGHDVRGATLYTTLEPCCHHGRTPPCTDAILEAGIERVVIGVVDRFPAMQGRSIGLLEQAGVQVALGEQAEACRALVRGFERVISGGLPFVTAKVAATLDGRIATASGESQWITGEAARAHGHGLRATHDAILVGIGTVLADDPRLTCRTESGRDPVPVVLDGAGRLPVDARLLAGSRRPLIFVGAEVPDRDDGADRIRVPRGPGGLDPEAVLRALGARGLHRVLVEGGAEVHRSFLDAGLVDELCVYMAGMVLPGGRPWVGGAPIASLSSARRFGAPSVEALGDDVLLRYAISPPEVW